MQPVIAIDPGHPSKKGDKGVVHKGFTEVEWTLDIALRFQDALRWLEVSPVLLREDMEPLSLSTRGELSSRKYQADLVISIHADANSNPVLSGMSTYHRAGDMKAAEIGQRITEAYGYAGYFVKDGMILPRTTKSIIAVRGHQWRGRAYNVLQAHEATAVLVECGVVTNEDDRRRLMSKAGKDRIVAALVCGVTHWLEKFPSSGVV